MKEDIKAELEAAVRATLPLKRLADHSKVALLHNIAAGLIRSVEAIVTENKRDLEQMEETDPRFDRLLLTHDRVSALAESVLAVAKLSDPTGTLLSRQQLENGLLIEKKTVPLGVVGVIYESRPNVTVDVAALCLRSGNVCLLRGGTDAWHSNQILVEVIQAALLDAGLDKAMVQLLPPDRKFVSELLTATAYVDILIPRGSQSLINFVREHAKVPVIETGAGVCHTYVEQSADLDKAAKIVANAKISRPSVCNSLDTILVDEAVADDFIHRLVPYFDAYAVEVFADTKAYQLLESFGYAHSKPATTADFGREFLALQCSLKIVSSFDEALQHIARYSSKHSECIVSQNAEKISGFMESVDAAAVYANASTRFTDGGEFGLGAEIGISTQKLHARGPFALEKLVTEKWYITGDGQIR
ncbi:glutamate-5-semialdehyde dehydrogenase [Sphingobacterium oryzagri]|uniref:Gamma-glutamyl phosphate reductase n=1 Tax=Sphingobacterium oryzagri TaxID=3025669 RepID=A0ABY7WIJ7_9SPHI|nr:glutamate-5-semialdehyde dehydrogenase [Sphingobacterium sp. KACC 22765]WDF69441.1 glutamate-5-semialdehyde dehydrogenase [Sphingobacterium sp. KACC 22765]